MVITVMESQIFRYRKNKEYYHLLGITCLQVHDYAAAVSYLSRAHDIDSDSKEILTSLAVAYTFKNEVEHAISCWLRLQELYPDWKVAQKGIELLRKQTDDHYTDNHAHKKLLKKLSPMLLQGKGMRSLLLIYVGVITSLILLLGVLVFFFFGQDNNRMEVFSVPERVVSTGQKPTKYQLKEGEIRDRLVKMKKYFLARKDNLLRENANILLHANISRDLEETILRIVKNLPELNFETIADSPDYKQTRQKPLLYHGIYVRWKGKVANLFLTQNEITFDFLIGYHNSRVLEGVVKVTLPFSVALNNGDGVEIVGALDTTVQPYHVQTSAIRPILTKR